MSVGMTALGMRRRKRLVRPPRLVYPSLIERAYQRDIVRMLDTARSLVRARVLPALEPIIRAATQRTDSARADDDYSDRISNIFDGIEVEYGALVPESSIRGRASSVAVDVNRHNRKQINRQVKTVIGMDVIRTEPWLDPVSKAFTRENVALIKSIPQRYFTEIERLVTDGARSGRRAEDIARDIEERYKVGRGRAKLIARDQVGKFNGELTVARHRDLGLGRYRWRTSMDERVRGRPDGAYPSSRPSHWDREGKIFSYDKPPPGGPPGLAIQCRCFAEPVFEDILGDEYAVDQTPAQAASGYLAGRDRITSRGSSHVPVITDGMTVAVAEDAIRRRKYEHVAMFGSSGELLHTGVGDASSAPVPHSVLAMMRERRDVTVTHNHPSGSPLSPPDIAIAITGNAAEMRAAIPTGGAWVMRRPAGGWRTRLNPKKLVEGLTGAYIRAVTSANRRTKEAIRNGASKSKSSRIFESFCDEEILREYGSWAESHGYRWRVERTR